MAKTETANKPNKPKKRKSRFVRWFKEMGSELKKVSWPTVPEVMKKTGVVLLVVLIFLLVLMGIDQLFSFLYNLLVSGIVEDPSAVSALSTSLSALPDIGGSLWL